MPALLPMLLVTSQIVLAADAPPKLDYTPSCRAAVTTAAVQSRGESACKQDEETARGKLEQDWGQFSAEQRTHCVQLSSLGGSPSYVELLTCLEMAKDARALPDEMPVNGSRIER